LAHENELDYTRDHRSSFRLERRTRGFPFTCQHKISKRGACILRQSRGSACLARLLHVPSTAPLGLAFSGSVQGRVCATFRHYTQAYLRVPLGRHGIQARICAIPPLAFTCSSFIPVVSLPPLRLSHFPIDYMTFVCFSFQNHLINRFLVFLFFSREVPVESKLFGERKVFVNFEREVDISRDSFTITRR
jgi:hypothetical protein